MTVIEPLPGFVLIEPVEDKMSTSGLVMPKSEKQRYAFGNVVRTNSSYQTDYGTEKSYPIESGMTVVYDAMAGQEVRFTGKKFYLMHLSAVLGTIEESDAKDKS